MTEKAPNHRVQGVDSHSGLKNLTRVTESQIKRTGANSAPTTSKPTDFTPPGQSPGSGLSKSPRGQSAADPGADNKAD